MSTYIQYLLLLFCALVVGDRDDSPSPSVNLLHMQNNFSNSLTQEATRSMCVLKVYETYVQQGRGCDSTVDNEDVACRMVPTSPCLGRGAPLVSQGVCFTGPSCRKACVSRPFEGAGAGEVSYFQVAARTSSLSTRLAMFRLSGGGVAFGDARPWGITQSFRQKKSTIMAEFASAS
ncbi:hypothetical protein CYMTET_24617 [Cymbomonas tetramitiformis]|uniref:Secreted protein n=1 Tax=Cymbomonas tetramitiformis TaxID=36881 RepID=A0AAE0FWC3_9CHLO|nr:hypothetical protein CYMTET_24617 [Cymbomonas tetramitiformis]